jgi:hypothetical protein
MQHQYLVHYGVTRNCGQTVMCERQLLPIADMLLIAYKFNFAGEFDELGRNFRLRKLCVQSAVIHRCDGDVTFD